MAPLPSKLPETPISELGIVALDSVKALAKDFDRYIVDKRKERVNKSKKNGVYTDDVKESYLIDFHIARFSDGEAKCVLSESVRGLDIYIVADIGNYSNTYEMYGFETNMGPDEHFQDIKRVVSAISGKARRISVLMPRLYASRQDKRNSRESLDCAMALQELERLGVNNILTFDAHSSLVQNAIPNTGFENFYASYNIIQAFLDDNPDLPVDSDNVVVISPDTGAMDRALYYANVLNLDVGVLYKRRDLKNTVKGVNKIIKHEYIGSDLNGKDVLIVDDIIASGGTMFDLFEVLKNKGAGRIFVGVTFALFTKGIDRFNEYYENGILDKVYSTNLSYLPDNVKNAEWFVTVNMSNFIGKLINLLNYDHSVSTFFDDTSKINEYLEERKKKL